MEIVVIGSPAFNYVLFEFIDKVKQNVFFKGLVSATSLCKDVLQHATNDY